MADISVSMVDIEYQEYIGKEEFLAALAEAEYVFKLDKDIECQELAGIYKRFVERGKDTTDHRRYLIEVFTKVIVKLNKTPEDTCRIVRCLIEPYYSYGLIILKNTGKIIAVIRGYDIRKTPRDVKIKVWGEEPELLDISKLNVDGTLKK